MKTTQLKGETLNFWVAMAMGYAAEMREGECFIVDGESYIYQDGKNRVRFDPTMSHADGGPVLDVTRVTTGFGLPSHDGWWASKFLFTPQIAGATRLEAGMRAVVYATFGAEVPEL